MLEARTVDAAAANATARQLAWVLQRIASAAGRPLDRLLLHSALEQPNPAHNPQQQLHSMCEILGLLTDKVHSAPDPARLPLIAHTPTRGWCLVVALNADGTWLAHTPSGPMNVCVNPDDPLTCFHVTIPVTENKDRAKDQILKAFWQHRAYLLDGVIATLLINLISLAASFFSMQVYDRVIPTQGVQTLLVLSIGVCIAIVFELVLKLVRARVMDYVAVGMDARLSRNIFQRLLAVRLDQLPQSLGSLAGQIRSYEGIRALLTASTAYLLIDVPFSLIFIVLIGVLATPTLLLVPLFFLTTSLTTGLLLRKQIEKSALVTLQEGNFRTGLIVEAVEGAETIKSGQGGWRFLSRWVNATANAIQSEMRLRHLSEAGSYLTATFQQLSYAVLVALGAWLVIDGQITQGALIACTILAGRALSPVGLLPGLLAQYAHAKAALIGLERIYSLEADNSGIEKPLMPDSLRGHYELKSVVYSYPACAGFSNGSQPALSVAELRIRAGDKVGVLGPVGAGKSTLLRLLSGMYVPQEGRILLDGLELSHIARPRVTEQVGYLQQDHRLFEGTLRDNLLIGLPDPGDDALITAARRTGLMSLISDHPSGLELRISEGGKGLSGGQRQLVAFTRLILTQPKIWLLDEPTAHMDDELERRCLAVLQESLSAERTAVIVTHKPSILPLLTHVVLVSQHRVLMVGTRDEVLSRLKALPQLA